MDSNNAKKGFSYYVSREQIEAFRKLPVEERLRWLEEAREFMIRFMPPRNWEILQKFRRGEI